MPITEAASPQVRRDLRAMTADGVAFSAMVGLGESYVPAFALAIGLGEVVSGLVATVPMLAGACLQMVTHIAAPYFTPYMLGPLELTYGGFMTLIAASFAARVAVLPLLGRLAYRRSARNLLWLGGIGIVPLPVLWLVSHDFYYLLGLQLFAGVAWGSIELATTLSFFEGIPESDRTSVLSAFNLANAVAIAIGALAGAQLFTWLDGSAAGYAWLFAISSAGRLLTLALLRRTPPVARIPEGVRLRTLAVRPSGVAVQRPILASLPDDTRGKAAPRGLGE
jgi:hypothetical protein